MTEMTRGKSTASDRKMQQVGKPLVRTDATGKAIGKTVYAGDHSMPGMLHARILRSPMASARLVRLDVSKARALEGVAPSTCPARPAVRA
jgi:putative selenate reductase molybdopterin-binding subunit